MITLIKSFYIRRKAANTVEKPPVKTQDNVSVCLFSLFKNKQQTWNVFHATTTVDGG